MTCDEMLDALRGMWTSLSLKIVETQNNDDEADTKEMERDLEALAMAIKKLRFLENGV